MSCSPSAMSTHDRPCATVSTQPPCHIAQHSRMTMQLSVVTCPRIQYTMTIIILHSPTHHHYFIKLDDIYKLIKALNKKLSCYKLGSIMFLHIKSHHSDHSQQVILHPTSSLYTYIHLYTLYNKLST